MPEEPQQDEAREDRRRQGIMITLPGGAQIEIRGITTIMSMLLVLSGVNTWITWQGVQQLMQLGDITQTQTRSINMLSCMLQTIDATKREAQYQECRRWFASPEDKKAHGSGSG